MGGNALKNVETRRYEREEYFELESKIIQLLAEKLKNKNIRFEAIQAYRNKSSFGDMDIIIEKKGDVKSFIRSNLEYFESKEHVNNYDTISFAHNDFQIDFIFVEPKFYNTLRDYYAYNDLGNLLGRMARFNHLKLGSKGLYMPFEYKNKGIVSDIPVTHDYKEALEFLGYDYQTFEKGFNDLKDIFDYVISVDGFSPHPFLMENKNNDSRNRDLKRPNYMAFLEYIDGKTFKESQRPTKEEAFERVIKAFPNVKVLYDAAYQKEKNKEIIKEKFNGKIVKKITGISGIEMGLFYYYISDLIKDKEKIIGMNEIEIETVLRTAKVKYDKSNAYTSFGMLSTVVKNLKKDGLISSEQEKYIMKSQRISELMKSSMLIKEPVAIVGKTQSYAFNANTLSTYLEYKHKIIVKPEQIVSYFKNGIKDKIKKYFLFDDMESINNSLETLREFTKKYQKEKKEKAKKKKSLSFHNNIEFFLRKNDDGEPVKVLCLDIEMYEKDFSKITEIGFSQFTFNDPSINDLHSQHLIVKENQNFRNGIHVDDNRDNFNFGDSKVEEYELAINIIKEKLNEVDYIVGNNVSGDLLRLFSIEYLDENLKEKVINTEKFGSVFNVFNSGQATGLSKSLEFMGIEHNNLHNAGNDSYYNLLLFKEIIMKYRDGYRNNISSKHVAKNNP